MLNPFHGVVNIVEIDGADALTRDGVEWMLYLQGEAEREIMEDGSTSIFQTPDVKYGTWSATAGFKRAPVRSVVDYDRHEELGRMLLEAVKASAASAPFALADRYELWLLESGTERPLALLDSSCERPGPPQAPLAWRPGQASHREFVASCLEPAPEARLGTDLTHAALLARAVNRAAGRSPGAQWFERQPGGVGTSVSDDGLGSDIRDRTLAAGDFPNLMLATDWNDPLTGRLANEFLDWQAPWLLQLQHISATTRARFERSARRRAALTASLCGLYPEVIDERQIKAALVEARIRETGHAPEPGADLSPSAFCQELDPFVTGNT